MGCFILTGASQGIGRAVGPLMAKAGYDLVLNARGEGALEEAAEACRSAGGQARAVAGSAADDRVCEAMVRAAEDLGGLSGFIHCAGVLHPGPYIWELTAEQADAIFEAASGAALALIRAAVPALQKRGRGTAVFFGSGAAELQNSGIGVYCAAKAAEEKIARQLAVEADFIATFIFRPGLVDTGMQEAARRAQGGAAARLRAEFQGFKEENMLLKPEDSARAMIKALGAARRYHGKTVNALDLL